MEQSTNRRRNIREIGSLDRGIGSLDRGIRSMDRGTWLLHGQRHMVTIQRGKVMDRETRSLDSRFTIWEKITGWRNKVGNTGTVPQTSYHW